MTNELFNQLWEWSHLEDSFSICDFADSIGMTYKEIHDLSKENKEWSHLLEISKYMLACSAEKAINTGLITNDCYTLYIYENDCFLRYELQEAEGIVIPENPDEFDEWMKERIKKDKKEEKKFKQRRGARQYPANLLNHLQTFI
jgi:hypothetical protein